MTDPAIVRAGYATSAPLEARASIYAYREPAIDLPAWVLSHARVHGDVLDAGCGSGRYLAPLARAGARRVVGLDFTLGILRELDGLLVNADVQQLPFDDATFDLALAMHVLFYARSIEDAARELARVLKRSGTVLILTNAERHLEQLDDLFESSVEDVFGVRPSGYESGSRFTLENGAAALSVAFHLDGPHRIPGRLVVPDAAPVLAYLQSTRATWSRALPDPAGWDDVIAAAGRRVREDLPWRCHVESGLWIGRIG